MTGDNLSVYVSSSFSITPKGAAPAAPPQITTEPKSTTVVFGSDASLSVRAKGIAPLSYQWLKNGSALEGENADTLLFGSASGADTGNYRVRVSNAQGFVDSATVSLTVLPPVLPVIKPQPRSRTVKLGGTLRLTTRAKGSEPLAYQWFLEGNPVPGANTSLLAVSPITAENKGNYFAVVSNPAGSVTSQVATVTIKLPKP